MVMRTPHPTWSQAIFALSLICICQDNVRAQTVSVVYGVQTTADSFVVKTIDLTDDGSFEKEVVRIDRLPGEQLTDIVQLTSRDVALIKVGKQKQSTVTRITNPSAVGAVAAGTKPSPSAVPVNGLASGLAPKTAVALNDTALIGLTSDITDTPPFNIVSLNLKSGLVTPLKRYRLGKGPRFGNLTRCPDNTIYATTLAEESTTRLVAIDTKNFKFSEVSKLRFRNAPLRNDVMSLACSPSGELYALADPMYEGTNSLFSLNRLDGQLTPVRQFDVQRITFNVPLSNQPLSAITGP